MVIISATYSELNQYKYKNSIITIGSFDGLHLGHQKIFTQIEKLNSQKTKDKYNKILITFDPHPSYVLDEKNNGQCLLTPTSEKIHLLEKLFSKFIDIVVVISFNKSFSQISAKDFFDKITNLFNPSDIVIGSDHGFGYKREGNIEFLIKNYQKQYNLKIHKISDQSLFLDSKIKISSTEIRKKILNNKINEANKMLSRNYSLKGIIIKGQGIGRKINFPTINVQPNFKEQIIPSRCVYFVKLKINELYYSGMCNIGIRPTVTNSKEETIEIHIFRADIDMNLYDNEVNVFFLEYIRSEKKFKNIDFLVEQLKKDRDICMSLDN